MTSRTLPEFLRSYGLRRSQISWFLGAGASASAGIATAWQMIWDFKRALYTSQEGRSTRFIGDIASPQVQAFLQAYFDATGKHPPFGADNEYAYYFEACYPSEADRRAYIEGQVRGGRPSFGHLALAELFRAGHCEICWTTNFDHTIEDASAAATGGTTHLRVAAIENASVARDSLVEARFPLLVKLHGDYHSRALRNTAAELREQDARMRQIFLSELQRRGVAIVGYSGRDDSVMTVLEELSGHSGCFPGGLFWFYREDAPPNARVQSLVAKASMQCEAAMIPIGAFDELMADTLRTFSIEAPRHPRRPNHVSTIPMPGSKGSYPALRLNALPVLSYPKLARLIVCEIGNAAEVTQAIALSGHDLLATRVKQGVIGFGEDKGFEDALASYAVSRRDVYVLRATGWGEDRSESGLVREALVRALGRRSSCEVVRHASRLFLVPPKNVQLPELAKVAGGAIHGTIPRTALGWREALHVRLDYRFDRVWLVIDPTVLADRPLDDHDEVVRNARSQFVRERLAARFNAQMNTLLAAWIGILTTGQPAPLAAIGVRSGVDAIFEIGETTAFSWRNS